MIGIYKITSPTNRIYIGQSIKIESRIYSYKKCKCYTQPKLLKSLKKYGWDKHKFEVLVECEREKLNELEKYYVDLYQTFNSKHGLNIKDGGNGRGVMAESTKKKLSNLMTGVNNPFYGKKHTEETKLKMRGRKMGEEQKIKMINSKKGKSSWNKDKKLTEEHRKKISAGRKKANIQAWNKGLKRPKFSTEWLENMKKAQIGKKHSEEHKKNHRQGLLNYWKKRKENEPNNCI